MIIIRVIIVIRLLYRSRCCHRSCCRCCYRCRTITACLCFRWLCSCFVIAALHPGCGYQCYACQGTCFSHQRRNLFCTDGSILHCFPVLCDQFLHLVSSCQYRIRLQQDLLPVPHLPIVDAYPVAVIYRS